VVPKRLYIHVVAIKPVYTILNSCILTIQMRISTIFIQKQHNTVVYLKDKTPKVLTDWITFKVTSEVLTDWITFKATSEVLTD
jgi:hypothetical protein